MVDISNLRQLRIGEEKQKKDRQKKIEEIRGQTYNGLPYSIGPICDS